MNMLSLRVYFTALGFTELDTIFSTVSRHSATIQSAGGVTETTTLFSLWRLLRTAVHSLELVVLLSDCSRH